MHDRIFPPPIVSPALATKTAPPSRGTAVAAGAAVGLIIGILAALIWAPLADRLKSRPQ